MSLRYRALAMLSMASIRMSASFVVRSPRRRFQAVVMQQQQESTAPFRNINNNLKADALSGVAHDAPTVILVRPFLDQNVGAAARAMLNFGMAELRLVDPQCDHLSDDAKARASGAAGPVLERARVFGTIAEATADLTGTFATTARLRDTTQIVVTPPEMARRIAAIAADAAASASPSANDDDAAEFQPSSGLLFGPERSGLTNDDLQTVDALVQIPTNPNFASLNLAQAVNICGYAYQLTKLHHGGMGGDDSGSAPSSPAAATSPSATHSEGKAMLFAIDEAAAGAGETSGAEEEEKEEGGAQAKAGGGVVESVLRVRDSRTEGLATKGEVNNFLSRLEAALDAAPKRFFKSSGNSGDEDGSRSASDEKKRAKIHASIRALFHRQTLSKREVQLLQGVVSALAPSQRSRE